MQGFENSAPKKASKRDQTQVRADFDRNEVQERKMVKEKGKESKEALVGDEGKMEGVSGDERVAALFLAVSFLALLTKLRVPDQCNT